MRSIKSIRVDLNLSQKQMAEKLGISTNAYVKKENGTSPLLAREFVEIHLLSGVPMEQIIVPR